MQHPLGATHQISTNRFQHCCLHSLGNHPINRLLYAWITDFGSWFQKQIYHWKVRTGHHYWIVLDTWHGMKLTSKISTCRRRSLVQGPRSLFLVQWESCHVFRREIFDQMRQSYDVIKIVIYQNLQIMAHHGYLFLAEVMYSIHFRCHCGHCDFCRDYLILFEYSIPFYSLVDRCGWFFCCQKSFGSPRSYSNQ